MDCTSRSRRVLTHWAVLAVFGSCWIAGAAFAGTDPDPNLEGAGTTPSTATDTAPTTSATHTTTQAPPSTPNGTENETKNAPTNSGMNSGTNSISEPTQAPLAKTPTDDSNCSPFRLDEGDGSMKAVPVREQGDVNLCFAYAAASMVDAWRFSHGDKNISRFTSPIEPAIGRHVERLEQGKSGFIIEEASQGNRFPFEYGDLTETLEYIKQLGSCDESHFIVSGKNPVVRPEVYAMIEGLYDLSRSNRLALETNPGAIAKLIKDAQNWIWVNVPESCGGVTLTTPNLNKLMLQIVTILKTDMADAVSDPKRHERMRLADLQAAKEVISALCKQSGRVSLSGFDVEDTRVTPETFGTQLRKYFPSNLSQAAKPIQPVAIAHCQVVLYNADFVDETNGGSREECGPHSSLIIGRRFFEGKCQDLIQNTQGLDCDKYSKKWTCIPGTGKLWVDESALSRNTHRITSLVNAQ